MMGDVMIDENKDYVTKSKLTIIVEALRANMKGIR